MEYDDISLGIYDGSLINVGNGDAKFSTSPMPIKYFYLARPTPLPVC